MNHDDYTYGLVYNDPKAETLDTRRGELRSPIPRTPKRKPFLARVFIILIILCGIIAILDLPPVSKRIEETTGNPPFAKVYELLNFAKDFFVQEKPIEPVTVVPDAVSESIEAPEFVEPVNLSNTAQPASFVPVPSDETLEYGERIDEELLEELNSNALNDLYRRNR